MPIIWQPAMSVGIKTIDDEHKYLFALVNCVELALKTTDMESIVLFVDQLNAYCKEHFTHEEKLQLRIKYPYYMEHKAQHQEILENLAQMRERFELPAASNPEEVNGEVPTEVEDYDPEAPTAREAAEPVIDAKLEREITALLRKWVLDHVLVVDRKMHPFLSRLSPRQLAILQNLE